MKFDVTKVNAPHPQPGKYSGSGTSNQTIAFARVGDAPTHNVSTSAINPAVSATTTDLQRSASNVPTNNSNPVHTKQQVSCTMCGQVIDGVHIC